MLSITNTVHGLFARSASPSRPRRKRQIGQSHLRLEGLEDRRLLSGWAVNPVGIGRDEGQAVTVDGVGNAYVTGNFESIVDFDPGPGTFNLTSVGGSDIFVAKYSSSGALVWARRAGGATPGFATDNARDVAIDGAGNIYIAGSF